MLISLIRTVLIYIFIIFAVRIMGKRQISELQTTELVVTLLISDLAVIPMQDSGQPLFSGLIPICVLIACEICGSVFMLKSGKFRRLVCGKPVIIIADGVIRQKEMKELRMSTEDLFEQLRQKDVFSIKEVKYAIVETNGMMSILKKPEFEEAKVRDLGVKNPKNTLEVAVVSDGEVSPSSLQVCGKDKAWLKSVLDSHHIPLKDVFIMTADQSGKHTIILKEISQ